MPDVLTNALVAIVVGGVSAYLAGHFGVRRALEQFRSERWWERKADAYTDILDALSDLHRYADLLAKESLGSRFSDEHRQQLEERHRDADHRLSRAMNVGGFIISDDVGQRLEEVRDRSEALEDEWEQGRGEGPPWEHYEEYAKLYASAIRKIRADSKADLEVP